jgi:hypothetical protein
MNKRGGRKMSNRKSFGRRLTKKATREAAKITKGVAREGGRIATGFVKGLINVFNPFR